MESAKELNIAGQQQAIRQAALEEWLRTDGRLTINQWQAMVGDASFRKYYRVSTTSGTFVAMDAPPPQENCQPYVAIAHALRAAGLQAPEIIAADVPQGFLLVTDFGDTTYLRGLNPQNADDLYQRALDALAVLQRIREVTDQPIPPFTRDFMWQEWQLHKEWFLDKLLNLSFAAHEPALDACYTFILDSAVSQPQVFMHRDYQSANLMVLPNEKVGILDFQDAFIGPVTYDLVSLLRDCYIDWPNERVQAWALAYKQKLAVLNAVDAQTFLRWFDLMGMQRHLKALLTFARKHVRDQQSQYLQFIPRTLTYLLNVSASYPELAPMHAYLRTMVQPAFAKVSL